MWPFLVLSVAFALIAAPLLLGQVPPNRFYGFRTPRSIADERVWYPVNRVGGRNLLTTGLIVAAVAAPLAAFGALSSAMAVTLFALLASTAHSFYFAATIVAKLDRSGPRLDLNNSLRDRIKTDAAKRTRPRQET